jgi:hypothetical protein
MGTQTNSEQQVFQNTVHIDKTLTVSETVSASVLRGSTIVVETLSSAQVQNNITFSASISSVALSGTHYGDGSNLTGISTTDGTKLPLSGGTLTGALIGTTATFTTSISAPALSGTFYGDGSKLTGIVGTGGTDTTKLPLSGGTLTGDLSGTTATFTTSVSAPALNGTFYGDGSKLTGISVPIPGDILPLKIGAANAGSQSEYARRDHVHTIEGDLTLQPYDNFWVTGLQGKSLPQLDPSINGALVYSNESWRFNTNTNNWDSVYTTVSSNSASWTNPTASNELPLSVSSTASAGNSLEYSRANHTHAISGDLAYQTDGTFFVTKLRGYALPELQTDPSFKGALHFDGLYPNYEFTLKPIPSASTEYPQNIGEYNGAPNYQWGISDTYARSDHKHSIDGDVGPDMGDANKVVVKRLQGIPISSDNPTQGGVLEYNGQQWVSETKYKNRINEIITFLNDTSGTSFESI